MASLRGSIFGTRRIGGRGFLSVATWMLLSACSGDDESGPALSGGSSSPSDEGLSESEAGEAGSGGGPRLDMMVEESGGSGEEGGGTTGSCDDLDELPTNQGCEFWAVDLPNVSVVAPFTLDVVPADQQFAVAVVNPSDADNATVRIFVGDETTPVAEGALPFDTLRIFSLPALNIAPGQTGAGGQAYRIESDLPIIAYQFQPLDNTSPVYSNDATILFPTHALTGDYTAITGDATFDGNDGFGIDDINTGAFVSVVATEDDTVVTLFPTGALHAGQYEDVVLARGEVLTGISTERGSPSFGNLSGSRVIADKPVAVFSGSVSTSEPSSPSKCCADHLEHQMLPLSAWGTAYAAAPAAGATGAGSDASMYRITGAFDATSLVYDPAAPAGAPSVVNAGQTVAFISETPFVVRSSDPSKSFTVSQFLLSNQYFSAFSRPGDPSMIVLPAAAQFQDRYTFFVPQGYARNFVTIVRPVGTQMQLDDAALAGASFAPLGTLEGVTFEFAHVEVPGGSHRVEADAAFAIIATGYDNDVSFGYAGGSGVGVISEPPPPPQG